MRAMILIALFAGSGITHTNWNNPGSVRTAMSVCCVILKSGCTVDLKGTDSLFYISRSVYNVGESLSVYGMRGSLISLGVALVAGNIRVPRPVTSITAFVIFISIVSNLLS